MKRLVIFSPFHPPMVNPRSMRMKDLMLRCSERMEVLMISNPLRNENVIDDNIRCHGFTMDPHQYALEKKHVLYSILKSVFFPDLFILNSLWHLVIYLIKYRRQEDIILTCSHPVSVHFAGLILKKWIGKKCFWIADIGDQFSTSGESLRDKWLHNLERKVIMLADRVVVNSDFLYQTLRTKYHLKDDQCLCITNPAIVDFSQMKRIPGQQLVLQYVGNTYTPVRPGIEAIRILENVISSINQDGLSAVIKLTGKQHEELVQRFSSSPVVVFESQVPPEQLIHVYEKACILISLGNRIHTGVPSKIQEYINSRLPVIHFCENGSDPVLPMLENHPDCLIFHTHESNPLELKEFITKHRTDDKDDEYTPDKDRHWDKLLDELNNCTTGAST
ncbi:MAG: hypothetical protein U0V49_06495 [Saprospiraceae bacterium]